jgi:hypothetical protein
MSRTGRFDGVGLALCLIGCNVAHDESRRVVPDDAQVPDAGQIRGDANRDPAANADGCYGERAFALSSACHIYLIRVTRQDGCRFELEEAPFDVTHMELRMDGRWLPRAGNWHLLEGNRVVELLGDACATFQDGQQHGLTVTMLCVCVERSDEQG